MIELLVVMVVIALLAGLLVPAVMRAVTTANIAAQAAELQVLSQSLASFQAKYGDYPPSRIVIAEDGDYSANNLGAVMAPLATRSISYLRKFWPRLVLTTNGTKPSISGGWYDVNGDHKRNRPYMLFGHECLVLFLGGVSLQGDSEAWGVTGFANNPVNPFMSAAQPPAGTNWPFSPNRTTPFFDFVPGRLKPAPNATRDTTTGALPAYTDYWKQAFLVYFAAYGSSNYDPDDVNLSETSDDGLYTPIYGAFQVFGDPTGIGNITGRTDLVSSASPNPYTAEASIPVATNGKVDLNSLRGRIWLKPTTYQLISAGPDGVFGIGGQYSPNSETPLPFASQATADVTGQTLVGAARLPENDNVTNFAQGKLN